MYLKCKGTLTQESDAQRLDMIIGTAVLYIIIYKRKSKVQEKDLWRSSTYHIKLPLKNENKQTNKPKKKKKAKTKSTQRLFLISFQIKKNYARFITEMYICSDSSYRKVKRRERNNLKGILQKQHHVPVKV